MPLLWILYAGYLGLSIGLLVGAAQLAGLVVRVAWPAHVIGVAGFSVMILAWSRAPRWAIWAVRCRPTAAWS